MNISMFGLRGARGVSGLSLLLGVLLLLFFPFVPLLFPDTLLSTLATSFIVYSALG